MFRNKIRKIIAGLCAHEDHCEIARLIVCDGFLWDFNRALELALFRTFASPSISGLLARTGEFTSNGQKRYDDTSLLMLQLLRFGYDSPEGRSALQRINRTHGYFSIRNEDYLFVLSTFMLDPIDWIQRYGWRRLSENEQVALYVFWRNVGQRMAIQNIPPSLNAMRQFSEQYVRDHFTFSSANRSVSNATLAVVESWLPKPFRYFVRPVSAVLLDEATRKAVQLDAPGRIYKTAVTLMLRVRANWLALFGRSAEPVWPDGHRTYPQGYEIAQLAPERLLKLERDSVKLKTVQTTD
ncbi:oxygenase MpaB family protein [Microbulbifer sp.]|uniref:oxygenase MpaB family protein n=1 Tax=Microbulbifer sp. TaxID=1908541 RepID=UPI002F946FE0